jgi:addiction module HigA family antidote
MTIARESIRKTDFRGMATGKRLAPIHPGEVLLREFIEPMGLTRYQVAKAIKVQQRRIDEICTGKRSVTAATALRFAKLFGMDAQTWMNLQAQYDLEIAERELSKQIDREVVPLPQAA